jgi:hypothetical protein
MSAEAEKKQAQLAVQGASRGAMEERKGGACRVEGAKILEEQSRLDEGEDVAAASESWQRELQTGGSPLPESWVCQSNKWEIRLCDLNNGSWIGAMQGAAVKPDDSNVL